MSFDEFLDRIVNEGVEAARKDYEGESLTKTHKREGSVKGLEGCRGKSPADLFVHLRESTKRAQKAYRDQADDYWYWRCREAEVKWVCNVVSAAMENSGMTGLVPVTARGVKKAASILGVDGGVLMVSGERPGK